MCEEGYNYDRVLSKNDGDDGVMKPLIKVITKEFYKNCISHYVCRNSLLVARLQAQIHTTLGVDLALPHLVAHARLSNMAVLVDQVRDRGTPGAAGSAMSWKQLEEQVQKHSVGHTRLFVLQMHA